MDKVLICKVLFWFAFIVGFAYMILIIEAASKTWFRIQLFFHKTNCAGYGGCSRRSLLPIGPGRNH